MMPTVKAAATQVALASDPALGRARRGKYFVDGKPAELAKAATDPSTAAKLWSSPSARRASTSTRPAVEIGARAWKFDIPHAPPAARRSVARIP